MSVDIDMDENQHTSLPGPLRSHAGTMSSPHVLAAAIPPINRATPVRMLRFPGSFSGERTCVWMNLQLRLFAGLRNVTRIRTERMQIVLLHHQLHASGMGEERTRGLKRERLSGGPSEL